MKRIFKKVIIVYLLICVVLTNVSCNKTEENTITYREGFSVHYIDVGEGDSIFINFGDGETMLIDGAEKSDKNYKAIKNVLNTYNVSTISYLLITHPDSDHIGNLPKIIKDYKVETAFVPYIEDFTEFSALKEIEDKLEKQNTNIEISLIYKQIKGENYNMLFLSPTPIDFSESPYIDINLSEEKTETIRNNVSPILYLDYKGVSFMFTGDAEREQEYIVADNIQVNLYKNFGVSIDKIDYLKVGHHGSERSSTKKFLTAINPQNAIISLSGDNVYGHPSSDVIGRLTEANENIEIYRTDMFGTVSVFVDSDGKAELISELK